MKIGETRDVVPVRGRFRRTVDGPSPHSTPPDASRQLRSATGFRPVPTRGSCGEVVVAGSVPGPLAAGEQLPLAAQALEAEHRVANAEDWVRLPGAALGDAGWRWYQRGLSA